MLKNLQFWNLELTLAQRLAQIESTLPEGSCSNFEQPEKPRINDIFSRKDYDPEDLIFNEKKNIGDEEEEEEARDANAGREHYVEVGYAYTISPSVS